MANDLDHNPWVIDTAGATATWLYPVFIHMILWHEPTTAGHALEVTDKDGKPIWSKYALAGGSGLDYDSGALDTWYPGLIVPTLGSGTVFVYIK